VQETRNAYKILANKPEKKRTVRRCGCIHGRI